MKSSPCLRWVIALVGVVMVPLSALAETAPAVPDVSFSILRVLGALALVLALFLGCAWLFKNWQRVARKQGRGVKLNILEVKSLGNRQVLYVVSYERQRMLLASSVSGVTLVSHLPESDADELEPSAPPAFAEALQRVLARKT